ncbi:MAG: hypothetical protein RL026_1546 [Pseudomonadota bacterium]|jgi:hypothetical protein
MSRLQTPFLRAALVLALGLGPGLLAAQQANNALYRPAAPLPEPRYNTQYSDMSSMAARRDLSGVWFIRDYNRRFRTPTNTLPPFTPHGRAEFDKRVKAETEGTPFADASTHCWPHGIPRVMNSPYPIQIIHSPGKITIVHEVAHNIRQIRMDQPMPDTVPTSFLGYSVGRWEGDVLVIETKGTDTRTWIDEEGIIHSDQLHTIERLRKTENGLNLENEVTIIDPVYFTRPWVKKINYAWRPDIRIAEYICEENNRNAPENGITVAK